AYRLGADFGGNRRNRPQPTADFGGGGRRPDQAPAVHLARACTRGNPLLRRTDPRMNATSKGEPAKQVAIDVLRKAGEPLHAKEIAKRVLASGRCAGLKGKTPEATISAMLAVGSKPGGPFARVDKGTYTLADAIGGTEQPAQAAKPTQ